MIVSKIVAATSHASISDVETLYVDIRGACLSVLSRDLLRLAGPAAVCAGVTASQGACEGLPGLRSAGSPAGVAVPAGSWRGTGSPAAVQERC
jgi:hypothetical protein